LVLCYGNIYRSPFAAAAVARALAGRASVEVRSAGFHPRAGRETPDDFNAITEGYSVNLRSHRSSLIGQEAVDWADVIVVMDRHNWDALGRFGASAQRKAVWLGAFLDDGSVEIVDPYGREPKEMKRIADRLHRASLALAARLVKQ
jgi:protein-tyrosine-phosphatase